MTKNQRTQIFNSLGSNYSKQFVSKTLRTLFSLPDQKSRNAVAQLTRKITAQYQATPFYVYKGRDAIELALRSAGIGDGDYVLTQAFACFAIEEAILRVGAKPLYVDVAPNSVNATFVEYKKAFDAVDTTNKIKAVLVQHLLGYPVAMSDLAIWCKQNQLLLIEDLAQSVGAVVDGKQVGSWGDFIIFSFGRDKVLDAISGGACAVKNDSLLSTAELEYARIVARSAPWSVVARDMLYPFFTWFIRATFAIGLGKIALKLLKSTSLMSSPTKSPSQIAWPLPKHYFPLVLEQWNNLDTQLQHRRMLATEYWQALGLKSNETALIHESEIDTAIHLRFPVLVDDIASVKQQLQQAGYYLSDRWYTQPADSGSLGYTSVYTPESCQISQQIGEHIFNLPTHQYVTSSDVQSISKIVKQHLY